MKPSEMNIPSKYDPASVEDKWYAYWMDRGFFRSTPDDREPYCVVIPPPNVTGVLHMGHMLNNTLQDVLVRRARMQGKNALWVPGTDHASIATEARVVSMLAERGIKKTDLTREEFLTHAWEWKEKHGGIILEQLKKLGASCDWERTRFTMDEALSESVIQVFVDLYNKGLIYRGVRMVNWDPKALTAVSDEEVVYREVRSKLYFVRYFVEGEEDSITIATTRPETILGDTAVCVHPDDERYRKFHGKSVIVPLVNRVVPVIVDEYVDREFGTGALKITPAHDINDYELGLKHNLESIDIFNDDGSLGEAARVLVGEDRFAAREKIIPLLDQSGNLVKQEDYINKVGFSERTEAVIEPKLSLQWFLHMKELSIPALENVLNGNIRLQPPKFKNTYRHWMENVKDWCISRQLWWGHRIPAWFYGDGPNDYVVAASAGEAARLASGKTGTTITVSALRQDEDVLDTWFSSWLWPISVFDGIRFPDNEDIRYYYPTNDLVTAPEILFFWVARMIIAGYEYRNEKPFDTVYLTGIVRDSKRRKMSKSLGNSPDPIDLIKKYSADGVRVGMLLCSPAGNDLLFDESLTEQGRNFSNKIWNAFRLVRSWDVDPGAEQPAHSAAAADWFASRLNLAIGEVDRQFRKYRVSDALMITYRLFWDEFSSWYLEAVKPEFGKPVDPVTLAATTVFLDKLMHLLHPFMPFITEEIWQLLENRDPGESLMVSPMPKPGKTDTALVVGFEDLKEVVTTVRSIRKEKNLSPREPLELMVRNSASGNSYREDLESVAVKLGNLSGIGQVKEEPAGSVSFIVKNVEYFVPLGDMADPQEEIVKLEADLEYTRGFLVSVSRKLENERFVNNAPAEVVDRERKKAADAEARMKVLEAQLQKLKG